MPLYYVLLLKTNDCNDNSFNLGISNYNLTVLLNYCDNGSRHTPNYVIGCVVIYLSKRNLFCLLSVFVYYYVFYFLLFYWLLLNATGWECSSVSSLPAYKYFLRQPPWKKYNVGFSMSNQRRKLSWSRSVRHRLAMFCIPRATIANVALCS